MQKQSLQHLPLRYRPYNFPSQFPVLAFLGDNWIVNMSKPQFLHFHNAIEIGHCINGTGSIYVNQSCHSFEAHNYSIIFPQIPHISVSDALPSKWEYLYIDPQSLMTQCSDIGMELWQVFYMLQKIPVIIAEKDYAQLYQLLEQIFSEFHAKKPLYQEAVNGLLLSLLAQFNRITADRDLTSAEDTEGSSSCIRAAIAYIYSHYTEPISISELSAKCCISESHFRRSFKNIIGISPLEYIQHYRIQQACHLIHLNQEPLNLIAEKIGYSSLSSFNRQFLQYMSMSPSAWKKEHLATPYYHEVLSYEDRNTKQIFRF